MVKTMLVGHKNLFAVEYSQKSDTMGYIRLWLENNFIGALEDEVILNTTISQLERFIKIMEDESYFESDSIENIFLEIQNSDDISHDKFLLNLGDSFDDFTIIAYPTKDSYIFGWKLLDNPFFEYRNYPAGILSSKIPKNKFRETYEAVKSRLKSN